MPKPEPLDLIWYAKNIGLAIGRSKRQTDHLLGTGKLPQAFKTGNRWCVSRKALSEAFNVVAVPRIDPKLVAEFHGLMQQLSAEEQAEVYVYWT